MALRNRHKKIQKAIFKTEEEEKLSVYALRFLETRYFEDADDFFKFVIKTLKEETKAWVQKELKKRLKKHYAKDREFVKVPEENVFIWLIRNSYTISEVCHEEIFSFLETALKKQILKNKTGENDFQRKMNEIKTIFRLNEVDTEIVQFFYFFGNNSNRLDYILNRDIKTISAVSVGTGLPENVILERLNQNSVLIKSGVLKIQQNRHASFDLDDSIISFLNGFSDSKDLLSFYLNIDSKEAIDLKNFDVSADEIKMIQAILTSGGSANLLFFGQPGTGKTEFARAVASSLGLRAIFVKNRADKNRQPQLMAAVNLATERDVIIVDEADFLINTKHFFGSNVDKGWLNSYIDDIKAKIIWISNEINYVEDSLLRRFSYSYHFKNFTENQRIFIWNSVLKDNPIRGMLSKSSIRQLAVDYKVNAGGITSAVKTVSMIHAQTPLSRKELLAAIKKLLSKHDALINGQEKKEKKQMKPVNGAYDASIIHTDTDQNYVLEALKMVSKKLKSGRNREIENCNLLFWGMPGTGKTEFAKYIADTLKMKFIFKRYSDLESPWVGMTEQNIAQAFKEAEEKKAILFIDEADSFFTNRNNARASWEVSRTNEFLTQMENFNGIFICCTNLRENMDSAAMRRFAFKIEFKPVKKEHRLNLYRLYFKISHQELAKELENRISTLENLTFGDIFAVHSSFKYLAPEKLTHELAVSGLEKEVKLKSDKKEKPIGFHAA